MIRTRFTELAGVEHPIVQGGMQWVGQLQGLIHDIPSCAELVSRIMCEAEAIIHSRLETMRSGNRREAAE
jgi:NAD(P)H-dependent flavin oxidoreductase YrpB (nitropropane dioxygenase family)